MSLTQVIEGAPVAPNFGEMLISVDNRFVKTENNETLVCVNSSHGAARLLLHFQRGLDGGLCVDEMMRVVRCGGGIEKEEDFENNLFAAGDCCCLERNEDHWFQIRLWRQARDMGLYAAKCITGSVDELSYGSLFELFVHATRFFGFKVRG